MRIYTKKNKIFFVFKRYLKKLKHSIIQKLKNRNFTAMKILFLKKMWILIKY